MARHVTPPTPAQAVQMLAVRGVKIADGILAGWHEPAEVVGCLPYALPAHASEIDETAVIVSVEPNPKHPDSAVYLRYAVYRAGMSVGDYVDLCMLKFGGRLRSTYMGDLLWDAHRSYVKLGLRKKA